MTSVIHGKIHKAKDGEVLKQWALLTVAPQALLDNMGGNFVREAYVILGILFGR